MIGSLRALTAIGALLLLASASTQPLPGPTPDVKAVGTVTGTTTKYTVPDHGGWTVGNFLYYWGGTGVNTVVYESDGTAHAPDVSDRGKLIDMNHTASVVGSMVEPGGTVGVILVSVQIMLTTGKLVAIICASIVGGCIAGALAGYAVAKKGA